VYPAGSFKCTITKQEYEYLKQLGIKPKILSAWYIQVNTVLKPYEKTVHNLYGLKSKFKGHDDRMYLIIKLMLNGFYGKMIQLTEHPDGKFYAGPGFNPIHAAIITANTRIKLTDVCNQHQKNIYAVHTDSVIMGDPLPGKLLNDKLGGWSKEQDGDGLLIACGIYQIGDKNRFRGLDVSHKLQWSDILKKAGTATSLNIPVTVVNSWIYANFRGQDNLTNRFINSVKRINLNVDTKRAWPGTITARKLLTGLQDSYPIILTDGETAPGW
jgi:hypothetical protein